MTTNIAQGASGNQFALSEMQARSVPGYWGLDNSAGAGRAYVSPNFVLEFARVRIQQCESTLSRLLGNMKAAEAETKAINEVLQWCTLHAEGWGTAEKGGGNVNAQIDAKAAFKRFSEMAPPGSPLQQRLLYLSENEDSQLNTDAKGGADSFVPKSDIDAICKEFEGMLKAVDRRTSEDQLIVNKEMGARAEVLQLAAMLIQSFNETVKAVLGRA